MGIVQNVIGLVRDIHDRQHSHEVDDELKNYMTDPNGTVQKMYQLDPHVGMALQQQTLAANNAQQDRSLGLARDYLRGLPEGADMGKAIDQISPFLQAQGVHPDQISGYKTALQANPNALMDDKAYDVMMKDRFTGQVVTPGSIYARGGKEVFRAPYEQKAVTTPSGGVTNTFDPNTGKFAQPAGGPTPSSPGGTAGAPGAGPALTVDSLRPLFVDQESGGSYTAHNTETGALGKYQIMPATGQALAQKIGAAWNPAMMTRNDPASMRYQDALGSRAIQDSIDFGGGDPAKTFSHYYGGPDTAQWGPKTQAYTAAMLDRYHAAGGGAGAGPTVTPTGVINPKAGKGDFRAATADELKAAGYPDGAAAQVGPDGKMVNLKIPNANAIKAAPSYAKYAESKSGLDELEANLVKLRDDPGLNLATGMTGKVLGMIPGTHARNLQGVVDTINSQKMLSLLGSLQASGGNPFARVTNMEASMLPKTLGNFALDQNPTDLRNNINQALAQIHGIRGRVNASALSSGVIDHEGNEVHRGAPASAPVRARDPHGVLHQLKPGGNPHNPADWETVNG